VRHHIRKRKKEILPEAKELHIYFEALGQRILERKRELKEDGVPKDANTPCAQVTARAIRRPLRLERRRRNPQGRQKSKWRADRPKRSARARTRRNHATEVLSFSFHLNRQFQGSSARFITHEDAKGHAEIRPAAEKSRSRKQARSIALSEARKSGAEVPKKKKLRCDVSLGGTCARRSHLASAPAAVQPRPPCRCRGGVGSTAPAR